MVGGAADLELSGNWQTWNPISAIRLQNLETIHLWSLVLFIGLNTDNLVSGGNARNEYGMNDRLLIAATNETRLYKM